MKKRNIRQLAQNRVCRSINVYFPRFPWEINIYFAQTLFSALVTKLLIPSTLFGPKSDFSDSHFFSDFLGVRGSKEGGGRSIGKKEDVGRRGLVKVIWKKKGPVPSF